MGLTVNRSPSTGLDIRETASGDYIITHQGKHYPVKREVLDSNDLAYLGYLVVMQNLGTNNQEKVEGSRRAYIYHNAEDANETCLDANEKEK